MTQPIAVEEVVTRWVHAPVLAPDARVTVPLTSGALVLDGGLRPGARPGTWAGAGRLVEAGRRGAHRVTVAVEVRQDLAEITVRPLVRRPASSWTVRHERRYFGLAHEAATAVAGLLSAEARAA